MQPGSWTHVQHDDLEHEHPLDYVQRDVRDRKPWWVRMIDARREEEYTEALHDYTWPWIEYAYENPHLVDTEEAWRIVEQEGRTFSI